MENVLNLFAANMAFENHLDIDDAKKLVSWLETEGVLDYQLLTEVYSEPESVA